MYPTLSVYNDATTVPIFAHLLTIILLINILLIGKYTTTFPFNSLYWSDVTIGDESWTRFSYARWTNYGICGDSNLNCTVVMSAFPYDPIKELSRSSGVLKGILPKDFTSARKTYISSSRSAFGLYATGLTFSFISLFAHYLFVFRKIVINRLIFLVKFLAFFFTGIAALLSTTIHCRGVSTFIAAGYDAKVGVLAQFYIWFTVFCSLAALSYSSVRYYGQGPQYDIESKPQITSSVSNAYNTSNAVTNVNDANNVSNSHNISNLNNETTTNNANVINYTTHNAPVTNIHFIQPESNNTHYPAQEPLHRASEDYTYDVNEGHFHEVDQQSPPPEYFPGEVSWNRH
ncbi:hypothetical protein CLIB1423_29S00694 [[Candida] railenensis]|uniref:Uncharacterized protein n=1 Tax=[Candida] railenensis TaxID=45579 RepID=A0A9P0W114_9ASCO|nr:hypothetical protein CLIB1423_29S00694 [[Candida] railenensis]